MSVKTYIVALKKFKILPTIITHTILHYHNNSNTYLFRMSLSRSLSQRSQFFSVRTSNRVQQPTLTQVQCHCHRISLLELESFLSTYIFSYSARHDIQLPIFWPPPHKWPQMDNLHTYIYTDITITTA
jgi:hypothetical protein